MQITLKLYGALLDYTNKNPLLIELNDDANGVLLKEKVVSILGEQSKALVGDCALSDHESILDGADPLTSSHYALLPPVCGG